MSLAYNSLAFFIIISISIVVGMTQSFAQMDMGGSASSTNTTEGSAINATSSPAVYQLANSSIQIVMTWQPEAINTNDTTKFTFEFIDTDTEQHVQNVSFSVHMSLNGKSMGHAHEGTAPEGIAVVEQEFDTMGSLVIIVESIKVGNTTQTDHAQFSLNVVPEFPLSVILLIVIIVGVIATSRLVRIKL